jgi:hypothetical protein
VSQRPRNKRSRLDDVLAGRDRAPTATELIRFVREVNPTGLGLPAAETARRYAVKSRLQSLLVRRFGDAVEVVPEPKEPGVVSLRYGPLREDVCHALVDALDEDARSWVRRRLDEAAASAPDNAPTPRSPEARGEGTPALVETGRAAIDAFDFEQGRELLTRALARGQVEAVGPLLALLVEHLAADADALALAATLPRAAREQGEIRGLLGLAAARAGDGEQAREWVRGLKGARAAAVLLALARAAVESGDLARAERDLGEARERDPGHAGIAAVGEAIAARRARERAPLEAEAARLLEEDRNDEAEARARAVLARFPDSPAAQRVLRAVHERRREARARELSGAAEAALSRGDALAAAGLLRQALAAGLRGPEAARAEERVREVEAERHAAAKRAEVDAAVGLLGGSDLRPGLIAYLGMDPPLRARVRSRAALPHLGWLDAFDLPTTFGARARNLAGAVLGLARAEAESAADPEGALKLLAAYDKVLQGHPRREEIAAECRRRLDADRRAAAAHRLREAQAAADLSDALSILREIAPGDLDAEDRTAAEALRAELERTLSIRQLTATHDRLRREGAPLRARAAAEQLLALASPEERPRWETAREEAQAEVQRAFRVHVDTSPRPCEALRDLDLRAAPADLHAGSGDLIVAEARGPWVFVRRIDLHGRMTLARAVLRAPKPLTLKAVEVDGDRLLLVGVDAVTLEISLARYDVLGFFDHGLVDVTPERFGRDGGTKLKFGVDGEFFGMAVEAVEEIAVLPRARTLWLLVHRLKQPWLVRVIDLDRGRVVREIPGKQKVHVRPLPEPERSIAVLFRPAEEVVTLHDAHGAPLEGGRIARPGLPDSLVRWPGGGQARFLMLTRSRGSDEAPVRWCTFTPSGEVTDGEEIPELAAMSGCVVVSDEATGLVIVEHASADRSTYLLGLRAVGEDRPALERAFHVQVPALTTVAASKGPRSGWILSNGDDRFELTPLGPEPRLGAPVVTGAFKARVVEMFAKRCHRPTGARWERVKALVSSLRTESPRSWFERFNAALVRDDPDRMMDLARAFELVGDRDLGPKLEATAARKHPENAAVRLGEARTLTNVMRWAEVRDRLAPIDPSSLDAGSAQHRHHMLGMALLGLGEREEARCVLREGTAIQGGRCDLSLPLAMATPLDAEGEEAWSADQAFVRDLLGAVETADARLAQGDPAGARCALDRLVVTEAHEVQSLGRLAVAWLHDAAAGEEQRFDEARALATFCAEQAQRGVVYRRELLVPTGMWDEARLADVAVQAARWLDETFGGPVRVPPGGL